MVSIYIGTRDSESRAVGRRLEYFGQGRRKGSVWALADGRRGWVRGHISTEVH